MAPTPGELVTTLIEANEARDIDALLGVLAEDAQDLLARRLAGDAPPAADEPTE